MVRLSARSRVAAETLRVVAAALLQSDQPDLTTRQLATFLTCYLEPEPQRLHIIAKKLNLDPAAVTRGVDRLEQLDLARRIRDPFDRRGFLVGHTSRGADWLRKISLSLSDQHAAGRKHDVPAPLKRARLGVVKPVGAKHTDLAKLRLASSPRPGKAAGWKHYLSDGSSRS